jgi:hypothetical protein
VLQPFSDCNLTLFSVFLSSAQGEAGDAVALQEFWSHTRSTNDIFGLAAQVIAAVALCAAAECADGTSALLPSGAASPAVRAAALVVTWEPYAVAHKVLWLDCVSLPDDVPRSGEAAFRDALKRLADGSRRRLAAALPAHAAAWPALSRILCSPEYSSRILCSVNRFLYGSNILEFLS